MLTQRPNAKNVFQLVAEDGYTENVAIFMPFIKGILVVVKNCLFKTNLILDVNVKSQRFS